MKRLHIDTWSLRNRPDKQDDGTFPKRKTCHNTLMQDTPYSLTRCSYNIERKTSKEIYRL